MPISVKRQRVINLMSLALAICCKDLIIIAADGRSTDFATGKARPPVDKIFELTHNSALAITGEGLVDKLDKYMDDLVHAVRGKKHTNIDNIAEDVREIIDRRNWAEDKSDQKKCHMEAIVVGYEDEPKVYAILDNRDFQKVDYCVHGNWKGAIDYLVKNVSRNYRENKSKVGDKVAIKMLGKASKANSTEIGKPYSIWHVSLSDIHELEEVDIANLDKRYNN